MRARGIADATYHVVGEKRRFLRECGADGGVVLLRQDGAEPVVGLAKVLEPRRAVDLVVVAGEVGRGGLARDVFVGEEQRLVALDARHDVSVHDPREGEGFRHLGAVAGIGGGRVATLVVRHVLAHALHDGGVGGVLPLLADGVQLVGAEPEVGVRLRGGEHGVCRDGPAGVGLVGTLRAGGRDERSRERGEKDRQREAHGGRD